AGGTESRAQEVQAETNRRFADYQKTRAYQTAMSQRGPAFESRNDKAERARQTASDLLQDYAPGLASIDTPAGIKTDVIRGALEGVNVIPGPTSGLLNLISGPRQVSTEEKAFNPNADSDASSAYRLGRTATAFLP